ncbi:ABC transporter permease [Agrobacterium rosae]|uniref:Peptide ABC transporter permease n=1 Tax=Agrobacterium rosae TaxID=1972867 RepID=A0AAE5RW47_9HYPH|nr:ABC transporter permease [Agrobacterium rosae]KAA3515847.1 ABC transporter permease [Agrobacterium rosae]KAA3524804.1 ABC transporter permease [Agrobacterium rosae]MCM2431759.1 ABC transporter permease [Agrobacterium rosae]MQB47207.1 ABC transporter permease [Agrobacterium rosae]POO50481.1 peptide ABC transporter permease [Agrobacterium rosae]
MSELFTFLRKNTLALAGCIILLLLVAVIVFGPMISPYSPTKLDVLHKLAAPSFEHWLGTDAFGRDIFTRIMYGGRATLAIGVGVVAIAFAVGVTIGMLAGFLGGWFDSIAMRIVDAILAFPALVLAIALAAAFGPSLENAMLAVAITLAPQFARVARSQALSISVKPYVEAAVSLGLPTPRILFRYIFVNGLGPLLVQSTLALGSAILQTASLGFLGLGAQPPMAEWGADVSANLQYVRSAAWVALAPGMAILLALLSFNLIGDSLADWFNPRRRNELD